MPDPQTTPSGPATPPFPQALPPVDSPGFPETAGRSSTAAGAPGELPRETEVWVGRTHWKHFLPGLVLWVIAASVVTWLLLMARGDGAGSGWTWAILLLWLISGLGMLGRMAICIMGHRYRLTTQRLFIEKGILSQTIDQTELMRVDDVRMHKSVLDRVFGLGTVEVSATDTTNPNVKIVGVSSPETVAEHIRSNMRIMRKRALFVENL